MSLVHLSKRLLNKRKIKNGCWEWTGATSKGYGQIKLWGIVPKMVYVHRLAAKIWLGFDINSKHLVCHHCDNTKCFNPDHLFIGNHADNSQDMLNKGRGNFLKGEQNSQSKLTKIDVLNIKELIKTGTLKTVITQKFNVSKGLITAITKGRAWRHI